MFYYSLKHTNIQELSDIFSNCFEIILRKLYSECCTLGELCRLRVSPTLAMTSAGFEGKLLRACTMLCTKAGTET